MRKVNSGSVTLTTPSATTPYMYNSLNKGLYPTPNPSPYFPAERLENPNFFQSNGLASYYPPIVERRCDELNRKLTSGFYSNCKK